MVLIPDTFNPRAVEVHHDLNARLDASTFPDDLFVVLGGDGFMLKTVGAISHDNPTFLGLNCGRVGFLLNDLPEKLTDIPDLLRQKLRILSFPRIQMEATTLTGSTVTALALNDIYLERMSGQTAHLKVCINGSTIVEQLVADGLICSTALGSTAYSFSAGASACHPTLKIVSITPICPHAPSLRPVVMPLTARVDIQVIHSERRPVRAVADGQEFAHIDYISIFDSGQPVNLAFFEEHDFTQALVRKLLVGSGGRDGRE